MGVRSPSDDAMSEITRLGRFEGLKTLIGRLVVAVDEDVTSVGDDSMSGS